MKQSANNPWEEQPMITLEDWLRADIAGTVCGVKGGDDAISDDQWASLAEAAHYRRKRLEKEQRRAQRTPRSKRAR